MYSIGIPVRDEERNIEGVIESIMDQTILPEEILVCVNNSKDRTRELVLNLSKIHPSVKLLESSPGKASAWNKIVEISKNKTMIFCDGDITLGVKNSIEILLNELQSENLTMVGASIIQLPSKRIIPKKLKIPSGQLYAIDLQKLDLSFISKDTINEDLFLALKSYPNIKVSPKSFFYANKPSIPDIFITQMRILKGIKQILDLGMENQLIELLEKQDYNKYKIKLFLALARIITVKDDDNLWKVANSTK